MNGHLNVLGYYTSSCLKTQKLSRNRFANERKYFGLHLFYVLYAIQCTEGLKAEAAEKERVYGLCDKTWSSV